MRGSMSKLVVCVVVLLLVSLSCVVACAKEAEVPREVKVGCVYSTTGPAGALGGDLALGARLATKYWNEEKGGITVGGEKYQINLIEYSSNTDPAEGVSVVRRLMEVDKVSIIIGDCISRVVFAQQPVIEEAKYPWINSAGSTKVTTEGFKYTHRCNLRHDMGVEYWRIYLDLLKPKNNIGLIYEDSDYGRSSGTVAVDAITKYGGKVVSIEYAEPGITDFYPVLTRLKALDIDAIYIAMHGATPIVLKQAKEIGLYEKIQWLSDNTISTPDMCSLAGELALGLMISDTYNSETDDEAHRIYKKYIAEAKGPSAVYNGLYGLGWDTATRAFMAIEKANSLDREKIYEAIKQVEWDGVCSFGSFNETGQVGVIFAVREIVDMDGKTKLCATVKLPG